ncbi:MAG: hypothetical protein KKE20_00955 [Nanoarchaeota archaeon]|nr:hypothetical protein [Nanoarchaeota archaeon]
MTSAAETMISPFKMIKKMFVSDFKEAYEDFEEFRTELNQAGGFTKIKQNPYQLKVWTNRTLNLRERFVNILKDPHISTSDSKICVWCISTIDGLLRIAGYKS